MGMGDRFSIGCDIRAVHRTAELCYRTPFGAVRVGERVRLALDVASALPVTCTLRLWVDGEGETLVPMELSDAGFADGETVRFVCTLERTSPAQVWYTFIVNTADGTYRYAAREGATCGEGVLTTDGNPPSFLLTVYKPRTVMPTWYTSGLVYQIFPDRFARGTDWRTCVDEGLVRAQCCGDAGPRRHVVEKWDTPPLYERDRNGRVVAWGFHGGTLSGIREKLPYLKRLGVTALYLNPIFEAASNHRYDTADYLRVDPVLGGDAAFSRLCEAARDQGISIILDGVFNHVGRDSVYFNSFGNYPVSGAAQSAKSPYRDWFTFRDDGSYASWWGVDDLPEIRTDAPGFGELICGRDGVIEHWMAQGARGWRLDVADELSDAFIARIKRTALDQREDALVVGEVWEDAAIKVSYGSLRRYFLGDELDGAMGYPLRTELLAFLLGRQTARSFADAFEQLIENYPPEALACGLNFLGTHDRERILTLLGEAPDAALMDDAARAAYRLPDHALTMGKTRFWQAVLLQMCAPGVPCIYYGDEAGLQGYADPYNRAPYPWGNEDPDCMLMYRNAIGLRKMLPELVEGAAVPFAVNDDVFALWRAVHQDESRTPLVSSGTCLLLNRSNDWRTVRLRFNAQTISDVLSKNDVVIEGDTVVVSLAPLGASVLVLRMDDDCAAAALEEGLGVLCHVTSVPTSDGAPGRLGADARAFVDWLAKTNVRYWQVLPVNPTDYLGSPYAGLSAFAGNPALVDEREPVPVHDASAYATFCAREAYWLDAYALHRALQTVTNEPSWRLWPHDLRAYNPSLADDPTIAAQVECVKREQFAFQMQWDALRDYAHERGIKTVGDMPMYVSADASDAWAHPSFFALDENGGIALEAGAPPDDFAEEGQRWGSPVYNWDELERDGYSWWIDRMRRALALYDAVRLDHFIGFATYYGIEQGKPATEGFYQFGPGLKLFKRMAEELGPLPVIAENLGSLNPAVRALLSACGFPGVDVLQFSDDDVRRGWKPARGAVAYTGTHDNQTLVGWCASTFDLAAPEARELARDLAARVERSSAPIRIIALQDALGLDDAARMNTPGTTQGNWQWRCPQGALDQAVFPCESASRVSL